MTDGTGSHHHRLLFEHHPDLIYELDGDGGFVWGNRAFTELVGRDPEAMASLEMGDVVDPADVATVDEEIRTSPRGETRRYTARVRSQDGRDLLVAVTRLPIVIDGRVERIYGIARDISERIAMQAALEASEQRFRGLFEGAGSGIAITDLDGRFLDANDAFVTLVDVPISGLEDRDLTSLTHPEDRAALDTRIGRLLAGKSAASTAEMRLLAGGQTVWTRSSLSLIRDPDGEPLHLALSADDITTAHESRERLQRSEDLQRLAGQLALVGGWAIEASDRTLYWSEEIYRILDAPQGDEPPLAEAVTLYSAENRARLTAAIDACLTDGTPFDLELDITTYAGRHIPVRAIAEAQRGPDGRIERIHGAFQDTSEISRARSEAADAAERLTVTLESMSDAFYTLDREWRFRFVNARAEELLHRRRDDLLGNDVWDEFPQAVGSELHELYHTAMETGRTQVLDEWYFPPLETWFGVNAYPSEQGLAVYFRNVAQARGARIALEEREATLRRQAELLDAAQDAILVSDASHLITFWNRSAERLYGWTAQEALGRDVRELVYDVPTEFDTATARLFQAGQWSGELHQHTRSGELLTVAGRWTLVRDAAGNPEAVLAINTDVTEQRRIEQQLLRAQRMESLGTLAGGVAHDLNNVLSPILLAADLLLAQTPDPDTADLIDTIMSSARRGADLVTQVLSFARGVDGERTPVEIGAILEDIRAIIRDTFPKDISLTLDVPRPPGAVLGDSTQLQQVLLNLAVNARDALPDGGQLTIAASEVTLDAQYVASTPGTEPGEYVLIEVEDNGIGMSPEVRDRVFEPFFTTKPQGAGTGLGLSTSAAITRSHGGFIRVYSELGRGSRFRLYLPLGENRGTTEPTKTEPTDLPRVDDELVLAVDDEAAVRAMTRQTLEASGYRVLEAANGAEAVSVFASNRGDVDVVLTDMMMPVMDGPATIHALHNLDPDVRIIGASGLHGNGKVAQAAAAGVRHFLPKPYTSARLLELLRTVLDGARSGGGSPSTWALRAGD